MFERYFILFPLMAGPLPIFDRLKGSNLRDAVTECRDRETAHRIVDLLNADEKNKALPARAGGKWVTSRKDTE